MPRNNAATRLTAVWKTAQTKLPLYRGDIETWFMTAAKIDGKDRLFVLPETMRASLEKKYGVKIDKNKVRHFGALLDGKSDFTADKSVIAYVDDIFGSTGEGHLFRAREVDGFHFSAALEGKLHPPSTNLDKLRKAYQGGKNISFAFGNVAFVYNARNPLVEYTQVSNGGIAYVVNPGGITSSGEWAKEGIAAGSSFEEVEGHYNKTSGAAEGAWTRTLKTHTNTYKVATAKATYRNGKIVSGTLQLGNDIGDNSYQPAKVSPPLKAPKPEVGRP